jgi:hypothetical protein
VITRWRLTEPVRFFLWPAVVVLVVVLALEVVAGEWSLFLLAEVLAVALLLLAVAAARASVVAPRGIDAPAARR